MGGTRPHDYRTTGLRDGKGLRDYGTTGLRDYGTTGLRDYGTTGLRDYGTGRDYGTTGLQDYGNLFPLLELSHANTRRLALFAHSSGQTPRRAGNSIGETGG